MRAQPVPATRLPRCTTRSGRGRARIWGRPARPQGARVGASQQVGLTYFGKRYLSPYLGRWVSADPLAVHGLGGDLNAYAYVHGRLLNAVDPVGLAEDSAAGVSFEATPNGAGPEDKSAQYTPPDAAMVGQKNGPGSWGSTPAPAPAPAGYSPRRTSEAPPSVENSKITMPSTTSRSMDEIVHEQEMKGDIFAANAVSPLASLATILTAGKTLEEQHARVMGVFAANAAFDSVASATGATGQASAAAMKGAVSGSAGVPSAEGESPAMRQLNEIFTRPFQESQGREMFRSARTLLAHADAFTPEFKADVFGVVAKEINSADSTWMANRGSANNAVGFFTGDARPFALAIDSNGGVWSTPNFLQGGATMVPGKGWTINYANGWTKAE